MNETFKIITKPVDQLGIETWLVAVTYNGYVIATSKFMSEERCKIWGQAIIAKYEVPKA